MASEIRFSDFKRKFRTYGVVFTPGRGSHWHLERLVDGRNLVYTIPTRRGRYVLAIYVRLARQVLLLRPQDGVSDEDFERA